MPRRCAMSRYVVGCRVPIAKSTSASRSLDAILVPSLSSARRAVAASVSIFARVIVPGNGVVVSGRAMGLRGIPLPNALSVDIDSNRLHVIGVATCRAMHARARINLAIAKQVIEHDLRRERPVCILV